MGVETTALGYAPRLNFCYADVKSCSGDDELVVEEVMSEWWGCRALMQKLIDTVELPAAEEPASAILSLPDDVMTMVFAQLPRQSLAMARRVCSSWKRVAEQPELASLRRKVQIQTNFLHSYRSLSIVP